MTDRKIAVLFSNEHYDRYDNYREIIEAITEWTVVSEEEFKLLTQYSYEKGFHILEVPLNQTEFIRNTVTTLLEEAKAKKEAEEKRKAKQKAEREANRAKQAERDRANKLKQLEKLQKELGLAPESDNVT
jgi:hypothetical protein